MPTAKARKRRKRAAQRMPSSMIVEAQSAVTLPPPQTPNSEAAPSASALQLRTRIALAMVLAIMTFALYYPVIHHPFSNYDDGEYVVQNDRIHRGVNWTTARWALTSIEHANWHPVTWLSHALDWQLFGPLAGGHHFTSQLLHVLNVTLLFLFLTGVTRSKARSLVVAALFALHPINVESVAWIAERKNVLCTFFFLLALLAYARYARRPNIRRYLLVALLFALGLASKPMVVTFPFVLLLLDYWPLRRIEGWSQPSADFPAQQFSAGKLLVEKLPLIALSAADSLITLIAQHKAEAIRTAAKFPLHLRIENAIFSTATYLWKVIWPARLAVLYPYPGGGVAAWRLLTAAVVLIGISAWAWRLRARHSYLIVGWLWFLGMLVPVIGLIQVGDQGMADRYAYLPLVGIFLGVGWGIFDLLENMGKQWRWIAGVVGAVVLAILAGLSRRQIGFWQTNFDLWVHTAAVTQNNVSAYDVAGSELLLRAMNKGLNYSGEAQVYFQKALEINPNDSEALMNTGGDLQAHGKFAEALQKYKLALQHVDDNFLKAQILSDIGSAYEQMGDFATAREYYHQGLLVSPSPDNTSFIGYARTFTDEKIASLAVTLAKRPTAKGYFQMGRLQDAGGYTSAAKISYQRAIELDPSLQAARVALDRDSKSKR